MADDEDDGYSDDLFGDEDEDMGGENPGMFDMKELVRYVLLIA